MLELDGIMKSAFPPTHMTGDPCLSVKRSVTGRFVVLFAYTLTIQLVTAVTAVPAPVATPIVEKLATVVCVQAPGTCLTIPEIVRATPDLIFTSKAFPVDVMRLPDPSCNFALTVTTPPDCWSCP